MVKSNIYSVIGPPGTGKTSSLARWVHKQADQYGSANVLVFSYTKAAATEIAGRDLGIPRKNVGTLHAFCYRMLGAPTMTVKTENEFSESFPSYALSGATGDVDDPLGEQPSSSTPGDGLRGRMEILRAQMVPRGEWPGDVQAFASVWDDWKKQNDLCDFTDLLERTLHDCDGPPGDAAVCTLDEGQDSSVLQLALFQKWSQGMAKAMIAHDPYQAIYDWTGASPEAIRGLNIPDENRVVLPQSYRLPRKVHALAERWATQLSRRESRDYKPRDEDGFLSFCDGTCYNPDPVIDAAEALAARGKTVMVLGSCSFLLQKTVSKMRERGVPFWNPYRTANGAWNPLKRGKTYAADRLLALFNYLHWTGNDLYLWASCLEAKGLLNRGGKEWLNAQKGSDQPCDTGGWLEQLTPDGAAAMYELDGWLTDGKDKAKAVSWWHEHALAKWKKSITYAAKVAVWRGEDALREQPKIVVGTAHSVKGGQVDYVFVYPELSPKGVRAWLTHGPSRDAVIRMFYVAFTRAREGLVFCRPGSRRAVQFC